MTPDTSLSNQQIKNIFADHELATNPKITRINIGFTNEVHEVDNFILKVYVRRDGIASFDKESKLYKDLHGKVLVPKLVIADKTKSLIDKPYIIYKTIQGTPAGYAWHLLINQQREELIKEVCAQMKLISDAYPDVSLLSDISWQEHICSNIKKYLKAVEQKRLLKDQIVHAIESFVDTNSHVLQEENIQMSYWDVHLDNVIVNKHGKFCGLVDFEHVDPVSIDYALNNVRQVVNYPHLNLSLEMEVFAKKEDYAHLEAWFKEFYPELFAFKDLDIRVDFYELEGLLRLLPRFPKAQQIYKRIQRITNTF